ncbi:hypothetical protein BC936DRAFT_145445 [Jimgerdemannia flammicorona]|uniref:Uncharacterized protein n=1 Tax=Jimgerdemannia flammicorona TaxID=994334 RepID=A0A433D9Z8_9FUNG|nr:hypothetical protein BC936DRAFT_145445 [Jimgerdemannia flammicorona]
MLRKPSLRYCRTGLIFVLSLLSPHDATMASRVDLERVLDDREEKQRLNAHRAKTGESGTARLLVSADKHGPQ